MRRVLALGLVAAALSGCALPAEKLGRDASLSWIRDDIAPGSRLTLGAPHGDDIRLMMICEPHSGAVDITISGRPGDGAVVELHSRKVWNRNRGAGHADEESVSGVDIDLQKLSAADPVLQSFADTGDLTVVFSARRAIMPNAFAPAHDFLETCRLP